MSDEGDPETPTLDGTYDLTTLEITDGTDTFTAYFDLTLDEESGTATFSVPMTYQAPGESEPSEQVRLLIVVDTEGDAGILSETYYAVDPETAPPASSRPTPRGSCSPSSW